jgi:predicted site-specific integrase-resolvase
MTDRFSRVRKVTARMLCQRYGVVTKTIDRWVAAGILPRPTYINGYRYWDSEQIEQADAQRESEGAAV